MCHFHKQKGSRLDANTKHSYPHREIFKRGAVILFFMKRICHNRTYDDPNAKRNGIQKGNAGRRAVAGVLNTAKHITIMIGNHETHYVR